MGLPARTRTADSDQRRWTTGLRGEHRLDRRRTWTVGVKQDERDERPIRQYRWRRHQCGLRGMADAHNAQNAIVAGMILLLRRRRAIVVGVTHADTVECIGGLCLRQMRERHDKQDLAPCGEHQGGKARGAYPSV